MVENTKILLAALRVAAKPEDVFGSLGSGSKADQLVVLKHRFKEFIRLVHPDQNPDLKDAGQYVDRLVAFRKEAEKLLSEGTYGTVRKAVIKATLRSKSHTYEITEAFRSGEVADLFLGTSETKTQCVLKIVRAPSDNDLLDTEARVLRELLAVTGKEADIFKKYLPKLLDSFPMVESGKHRRVNVLEHAEGYFSLAEIRSAYPDGLDTRDAAWMIRRAFEVVGWIHKLGYVHGAVIPEHLVVHPTGHAARLLGWSYAVKKGQSLLAVSASRKGMYPSGVLKREPVTPALDIRLIAECGILLLSDSKGKLRSDVPSEVSAFLSQCRAGKVRDGWDAYKAYDEVLKKCFGKRRYRAFAMPPAV